MSPKLKKALIAAIATFVSALTGYSIAPDALELLCNRTKLCEASQ